MLFGVCNFFISAVTYDCNAAHLHEVFCAVLAVAPNGQDNMHYCSLGCDNLISASIRKIVASEVDSVGGSEWQS